MKRKAKRWCVWMRWHDDGPPRFWSPFSLVATFENLNPCWTAKQLAQEYRESCWTAKRQAVVLPEGQHPRGQRGKETKS